MRLYDNSDRAEWVRVMDEAWKSLAQREGLRIRVVVEESPEDRALRESATLYRSRVSADVALTEQAKPMIDRSLER